MQKTTNLLLLFVFIFTKNLIAQTIYTPCYYINSAMANELYKNGDTKNALRYFEAARASSQGYHRVDAVAVAACYAAAGDKTAALMMLKTAIDKGRRFEWFENVYYFESLKQDSIWQALSGYTPKIRKGKKSGIYHDITHQLVHEMEEVYAAVERDPNQAGRIAVLDSAAALVLTETLTSLGTPSEGELDDEDMREFVGLFTKVGVYDKKTYETLRPHADKMLKNGVIRAKEYAYMIDTWNSLWGKSEETDVVIPLFGNDQTNLTTLTKEQLDQINQNRVSIGLLPYGMDISAESQQRVANYVKVLCK